VLQTILNLHEFMELDENKQKVFDERTLAQIAEQCNAYAKALYYWEMEFQNDAKSTIEQIITTNYGLGQPEAAKGILISAMRNQMIEKEESYQFETAEWLEKRHEWNLALQIYSDQLIYEPKNHEYQRGKLKCLKNLYDWENLSSLVGQMWEQELQRQERPGQATSHSSETLLQIAQDGLESSWNLGEWTDFSKYIKVLRRSNTPNSFAKSFYQAILEIKKRNYPDAVRHIERAREILDP
jgi:serine/threonine-protein kinase mTOR